MSFKFGLSPFFPIPLLSSCVEDNLRQSFLDMSQFSSSLAPPGEFSWQRDFSLSFLSSSPLVSCSSIKDCLHPLSVSSGLSPPPFSKSCEQGEGGRKREGEGGGSSSFRWQPQPKNAERSPKKKRERGKMGGESSTSSSSHSSGRASADALLLLHCSREESRRRRLLPLPNGKTETGGCAGRGKGKRRRGISPFTTSPPRLLKYDFERS